MSRVEIKGDTHTLVFGIDHVVGAFIQLWINPADDQDCAAINIDSHFGVRTDDEQMPLLNAEIQEYVDKQRVRFHNSLKTNSNQWSNMRPSVDKEDVIDLAKCVVGIPDVFQQVNDTFD